MGFFRDAFNTLIGIDDNFADEPITQAEIDAEKHRLDMSRKSRTGSISRDTGLTESDRKNGIEPLLSESRVPIMQTMNTASEFKIVVVHPTKYEEATKLVDKLKDRKPVIVSFESAKTDQAQKIFSFLSGATYSLNGTVQRISENIYMFAASNVKIDVSLLADSKEEQKSPWD